MTTGAFSRNVSKLISDLKLVTDNLYLSTRVMAISSSIYCKVTISSVHGYRYQEVRVCAKCLNLACWAHVLAHSAVTFMC